MYEKIFAFAVSLMPTVTSWVEVHNHVFAYVTDISYGAGLDPTLKRDLIYFPLKEFLQLKSKIVSSSCGANTLKTGTSANSSRNDEKVLPV